MKIWCRQHKLAAAGIMGLFILTAAAIAVPLFSTYSYSAQDVQLKNLPSSLAHLFGTDKFGRDLFVRVWYGTRISLIIGVGSALINGMIGILYGGAAGFIGGRADMLLMRSADVISSIPSLLYIILITMVLGANVGSLLLGICIAGWISTARIVRGEVLRLKEMEYVMAAKLSGMPKWLIFLKHLLPGTLGPVIVNITVLIPQAIFTEAFLSFVGIGIEAPMASLGTLIQDARSQMQLYPSQMVYPILVLCLLVVTISFIGADLERSAKSQRRG